MSKDFGILFNHKLLTKFLLNFPVNLTFQSVIVK